MPTNEALQVFYGTIPLILVIAGYFTRMPKIEHRLTVLDARRRHLPRVKGAEELTMRMTKAQKSEIGRLLSSLRKNFKNAGRKKLLLPCPKCGDQFGAATCARTSHDARAPDEETHVWHGHAA